jgi:16S rRNA (adenine1518-N6/adenine1519-N6)-dimethyltransferase
LEARAASRTLASPATVTALLESANIRPSRSQGQNFLVDANILRIIIDAAGISPLDTVIEVGAGLGALTQALVENSGRVYAIESDDRLIGVLKRELGYAKNLVLEGADAARFDLNTLWETEPPDDVKMVSNLPYKIAATLIVDCLTRYDWKGSSPSWSNARWPGD